VINQFFDLFNVKEDLRLKIGQLYQSVDEIPIYKLPFGAKFEEQKKLLEEVIQVL